MSMLNYGNEPQIKAREAIASLLRIPIRNRPRKRRKAFLSFLEQYPGLYIKDVCCLLGINSRTVKRWARDAEFRQSYRTAQEARFYALYCVLGTEYELTQKQVRAIKCYLFNFDPNYSNRILNIRSRSRITHFLMNH